MGVIIKYNKVVIIIEPKAIYFDLLKKVDCYLKKELDFITKHNEFSSAYKKRS